MSYSEGYSWAAIFSNLAFLVVYALTALGIPTFLEPFQSNLFEALLVLILIDLVVQAVLEYLRKNSGKVHKDERDQQIEAKGFRVGYYVFLVAIVVLVGHLFAMSLVESVAAKEFLTTMQSLPLHYLVLALVAGTSAKSITQIVHYRQGA